MGLPSGDDRPPGASNGTSYYDDIPDTYEAQEPQEAPNGQDMTVAHRQQRSIDDPSLVEGRPDESAVTTPSTRERPRADGKRKASDKQRQCGKCYRNLAGQFVRALGDTYHLECFTCHVRSKHLTSKPQHH